MKKAFIYLFTAVFLLVAVFCGWHAGAWDGVVALSVQISTQEGQEELRCWNSGDGVAYLFLPGYARLDQVRLYTNTHNAVYIDTERITDGMSCEAFAVNTDLDLAYEANGQLHHFVLRIMQSADVPAMFIDTASGSMEHIHEVKGNEEQGTLRLYTPEGELDFSGNMDSLKGRGNDSWGKEKKPYSLKLSKEADLLGLGQAQKWVLFSNFSDPTHMRNKIVYDLAETLEMSYPPSCQWVDLYLNQEYAGVYLLSERNEIHPQRVDIPVENSFLVSMEPVGRLIGQYPYAATDSNIAFRIRASAFSQEVTENILQTVDRAIHVENGIDPVTEKHWKELIDLDSWARKYLVEEVFGNLDANAASQFFYYVGDGSAGMLYAGPVWDYDLSMGSHKVWQTQATDALFAASAHIWSENDHPWFAAMIRHPEFQERVTQLYQEEFRPKIQTLLDTGLQNYAQKIRQTAAMNQLRWGSEDFEEHVGLLQEYLEGRMAFLDSYWLGTETYHIVTVNITTGANIGSYVVRSGETLKQFREDLAVWQGDNYGWHRVDTQEVFDITQPIYEDVDLYINWYPMEEKQDAAEYSEEIAEEPLSLLRLGPAIVFAGMLVLVCTVGISQSMGKSKKTPVHN